jgi:tetratricopeptide (TPR) repeat protein
VALIAVVTLVSFFSCLDNDFVNWDDNFYVTENRLIKNLSWSNTMEIFFSSALASYVPLVTLSFSIEYALWGLDPFGYHLTNLMLHIGNSLVVFVLVLRLSRYLLPALVAALLFGVHPLHVESVAWVSERKDMLSTLFFLGALLCYLKYRETSRARFYVLSLAAFVLSLLSKAMAITLPLILILSDYRSGRSWNRRLLLEKVPFLLISVLFAIVEILGQHSGKGLNPRVFALGENVQIALWGVVFYLRKSLAPVGLSAYYPYPAEISLLLPAFFLPPMILLGLAVGVWVSRRYTREVVFGSLFCLMTLLPVLKFVPFGRDFVAADRYMYIPSIGVFYLVGIAVHWAANRETRWERAKAAALTALVSLTVLTFSVLTWKRCDVWQDSESFWLSVLADNPDLAVAHNNLGNFYRETGRLDAAIDRYRKALALDPAYAYAHNNLGLVYSRRGRLDAAIEEYKKALAFDSTYALAHNNLGNAYEKKGRLDEAFREYEKALALDPTLAKAYNNLGNIHQRTGLLDAAIVYYEKALALDPSLTYTHYNLGVSYEKKGRLDAAVGEYEETLRSDPTFALAHFRAGNIWDLKGDLKQAISYYEQAMTLDPKQRVFYYRLASALRADGQVGAAIALLQRMLGLFPGDRDAARTLEEWGMAGG